MSHQREPKGLPSGGQFAAQQRSEPDLELKDAAAQMPVAGYEPELTSGTVSTSEAAAYLSANVADARQFTTATGDPYFTGRRLVSAEVAAALLNPAAGPKDIRDEGKQLASNPPEVFEAAHEQHIAVHPLTGRLCQKLAGHFLNEAIAARRGIPDPPGTDAQWEQQGAFNAYVEAAARFSDGVERRRRGGTRDDEERIIDRIRDGETDADHILKTIWDEDC